MNPILPTAPALPPQTPVTPVGQILATLTQIPQSINSMLVSALLSGTVIGRDNKGQILLQTGQGVFGIKTSSPLQIGSTVTFEVQSAGAQLQTVLLSVTAPNAKPQGAPTPAVVGNLVQEPVPPAPAGAAQHQAPQSASSSAAQASTTTTTPHGATVTATVIAPPGGHPAASPVAGPPQTAAAVSLPASPTPSAGSPTIVTTGDAAVDLPGSTAVFARAMSAPASALPSGTPPSTPMARPAMPAVVTTQIAAGTPEQTAAAPATPGAVRPVIAAPPTLSTPTAVPGAPALPAETPALPALPTGTQVQVRVLPNPQAATNAPPGLVLGNPSNMGNAAPTVPAAIVGRTPQGQTIVETPVGRLAMTLPPTQEAVPGKILALELSVITRPASPEPPPLAQRHSAMSITHEWPALKAAVIAAEDGPDHVLKQALDEAVPRPGPRLAQQLLQAVAGGDTRQALIESVVKPLERAGLHELAQRIESDLQDLQKLGTTPAADWRLSFVPFFDGQDVRQLRIFTRRKKQEKGRKDESGTRFVIECEHGELGPLQLDGFLNKQSLDVIVRSHGELPAWMKGDMIALFTDSCGAIGMHGQLQFNAAPAFPVAPMDEIAGAGAGVLV